jgi:hypothetical protein
LKDQQRIDRLLTMPFPLAHPVAVLPLRRFCSRWLNFPALVIGSLVPDIGYLFRDADISRFSHRLFGSLAFGLPFGILMLSAFYAFRSPAVEMFPVSASGKRTLASLCQRPVGPLWLAFVSLVIGIWTHVLWDSFTHSDGWIVQHVAILQTPVIHLSQGTGRICHVLWYGSTFAGVGVLFIAFERWKQSYTAGVKLSTRQMIQDAIILAVLVVPVSLMHHLIGGPIVFVLTAAFCIFVAIVLVMKTTKPHQGTSSF